MFTLMVEIALYTPVLIEWFDASTEDQGWLEVDEIETSLPVVISVGLLILQNPIVTIIALDLSKDGESVMVNGLAKIPTCNIKRMIPLAEVNPRPPSQ